MPDQRRKRALHGCILGRAGAVVGTLAAFLATVSAGCGAGSTSATTSAAHVPNPFRIVARYSASSLGLRNPRDLAIGPNGNLYITDASDRVTVVSPTGKVLRRWGKQGRGPGQFHFVSTDPSDPTDVHAVIAIGPGGKVYVSDSGNYRVEVFSPTGRFIRQFGSFGYQQGQFTAPIAVAADATGDVYVADDNAETVSKFSSSGRIQWSVGGPESTNPALAGHFDSLNVDPHNRVLAAVDDAHAIVYLDAAGHLVDSFSTRGYFHDNWGPCGVALAPDGDTVVEGCPGGATGAPHHPYLATLLFDPTHHLIGAWYHDPIDFEAPPQFGPRGEIFALGIDGTACPLNRMFCGIGSSVLRLNATLPGA